MRLFLYLIFSKFSLQEITSYDFIKNNRDYFFDLRKDVKAFGFVNSKKYQECHVPKLQYDFLRGFVRKKKRFNKWLKPEKEEHLEIVKEYFGYSNVRAQEALRLLSEADIEAMKGLLKRGGK